MKLIDVHSHWGTRRGYPLQTEKELAQQRATWNSETKYHTEAEMADHFRQNGVRAIHAMGAKKIEGKTFGTYGQSSGSGNHNVSLKLAA